MSDRFKLEPKDLQDWTADEHIVNARLIAAAPDLLAALRAEQAVHDHWDEFDKYRMSDDAVAAWETKRRRLYAEADRLRAIALAKAGGESDAE